MMRLPLPCFISLTIALIAFATEPCKGEENHSFPDDWVPCAPRDELRPTFAYDPKGGPKSSGAFVISHDEREGLDGWMQKSFEVKGGSSFDSKRFAK